MKRLFEKYQSPKKSKALKIIGYTALGIAAAALLALLIAFPILASTGMITFY